MSERLRQARGFIRNGFAALSDGKPRDAAEYCRRAIQLDPARPEAHFLVGLVALEMADRRTAIQAFGSVTRLDPANPAAWAHLARLFMQAGQSARAEKALAEAVSKKPTDPAVLDLIGVASSMLGDQRAAKGFYKIAVEKSPENEAFRINLASACMFLGESDEALKVLAPLLDRVAPPPQAEWLRSSIRKQSSPAHPQALLERAKSSDPRSAAFLAYAAGKEFEDCAVWERAFEAFDFGARAKRKTVTYDETADDERFSALQAVIDDRFAAAVAAGCDDPSPIFVVGQPRTGTTLIERIITSHSMVKSAGELQQFRLAIGRLTPDSKSKPAQEKPIIEQVRSWAQIDPKALGEEYVRASAPMRGGAARFVDKLPGNYLYIPFILKALPNARIVHLTRDPMDACFASFKQLFAEAYLHSYDQSETARHFSRYWRLMKRWRDLFPGAFLDISYEETIADIETNARRLIEFLGLPWQDRCLRYYEESSPVATASAVQVREKPHNRSVGRWRKYESQLAPMRSVLLSEGVIDQKIALVDRGPASPPSS